MPGEKKYTPPTTMSPELLDLLVCPESYQPLAMADAELLQRLNEAVRQGRLANRAGQKITAPVEAGLIRQDRAVLYLVSDGIPIMLADEGVLLEGL